MKNNKPAKAEEKTTPEKVETETPVKTVAVPMTPEEQAIAARVSKVHSEWDQIKEEELVDFSLSVDSYALPVEAKKLQDDKKFAFRFIEMTPKRIDEITNKPHPAKWDVVNRTSHPELANYCDPVHGAVQKEDQILVYKPWKFHARYQETKTQIAVAKDESGSLEGKDGKTSELQAGVTRTEMKTGSQNKISGGDVVMSQDV